MAIMFSDSMAFFSSYNLMSRKSDLHVYAHRDFQITLDHFRNNFGTDLSYQIVFHPFKADMPYQIFNDKHMTVDTLPLRHSVPVVGFIFREKLKPLNIRKDVIGLYNLGSGISEGSKKDMTTLHRMTVSFQTAT